MSKIKVSTLTGPLLNFWVGRSNDDGREYLLSEDGRECLVRTGTITAELYSPSTDWAQGGEIIEREKITVYPETYTVGEIWFAHSFASKYTHDGSTPLIASMRAFVASKFGEEVDE